MLLHHFFLLYFCYKILTVLVPRLCKSISAIKGYFIRRTHTGRGAETTARAPPTSPLLLDFVVNVIDLLVLRCLSKTWSFRPYDAKKIVLFRQKIKLFRAI